MRKYRNDIILILVLLFVAFISIIFLNINSSKDNLMVCIYYQDELIYEEYLDNINNDKIVEINGRESIVKVLVNNDGVKIIESGCLNHVCINQGLIDKAGQTISCLPNEIYIILRSKEGVDATV